jgi:hypothetical protein
MRSARQQVGVWSEYGVGAVRVHFWANMERAKAGAKRQTYVPVQCAQGAERAASYRVVWVWEHTTVPTHDVGHTTSARDT